MSERPVYKRGGGFILEDTPPEECFVPEDFTDEQKMFAQAADDFMEKEVLPKDEEIEKQNFDVTRELMRKAGELGLLGIDIPEKYGGLELDKVSSMLITEKMSKQASFSVVWGAHTGIGTLGIVFFGTEEQKEKYLPGLASGEIIAAYALTEPNAGSDAMNIKTKAVLSSDGTHYILNGTKQFITNAGMADLFTLFAKIDGEHFTAFLVERGTPGLIIGQEEKKLGIKGSSTCNITIEDLKIPKENVLGEIGKGHRIAFGILNIGRYKLGVGSVGAAKDALKYSVRYAKERVQFGVPIASFGMIKEKLARMALGIFVGETMAYRLAGLMNELLQGIDSKDPEYGRKILDAVAEYAVESSILKIYGSEMLDYAVDEMMQIYGGYGYSAEYPAEKFYRDSRINRIFEGTNEINRIVIPAMLMRRAMKGQIPLIPKAAQVVKSIITLMPSTLKKPEGPLGEEKLVVDLAKQLLLTVAGVASNKFKENIRNEQEVLKALSDLAINLFGMESVWLRAKKVGDPLMEDMVRLVTYENFNRMVEISNDILAYMLEGDELRTMLSVVRKLRRVYEPPNTVMLRRRVADKVIDMEKYPF